MTKPDHPLCLPLAKAPFRYRAIKTISSGAIKGLDPYLLAFDPQKVGDHDPLGERLQVYLGAKWLVLRSEDGFRFNILRPGIDKFEMSLEKVSPVPEDLADAVLLDIFSAPLKRLWKSMTQEFGWAVGSSLCVVHARFGSQRSTHPYEPLPAAAWDGLEVINWKTGEGRLKSGEWLYEMIVCPAGEAEAAATALSQGQKDTFAKSKKPTAVQLKIEQGLRERFDNGIVPPMEQEEIREELAKSSVRWGKRGVPDRKTVMLVVKRLRGEG